MSNMDEKTIQEFRNHWWQKTDEWLSDEEIKETERSLSRKLSRANRHLKNSGDTVVLRIK